MAKSELPYEALVKEVCGSQWKMLPDDEKNVAYGVAIVKSVLDGLSLDLYELSHHLGVDKDLLRPAFKNLLMNGVFQRNKLEQDREELEANNLHTWCYYAGYASAFVGPWRSS